MVGIIGMILISCRCRRWNVTRDEPKLNLSSGDPFLSLLQTNQIAWMQVFFFFFFALCDIFITPSVCARCTRTPFILDYAIVDVVALTDYDTSSAPMTGCSIATTKSTISPRANYVWTDHRKSRAIDTNLTIFFIITYARGSHKTAWNSPAIFELCQHSGVAQILVAMQLASCKWNNDISSALW